LPIVFAVHAADVQDRDGALAVIKAAMENSPSIKKIWADGGYSGKLIETVLSTCGVDLEIVKRSDDAFSGEQWLPEGAPVPVATGFKLIKQRWIVERTFGWLGRQRRLSKDYEQSNASSLAWMRIAMIWLLARRAGAVGSATA
jgi:putative transposase